MGEQLNDEVYADITIPPKLIPVFESKSRYKGAYGGRGSAKTRTFALMTAVEGYRLAEAGASGIILCGREYMNSLEESSLEEIKQAIRSVDWLNDYYEIGEKYVRTKNRRVAYAFTGLRHNLDSIKGKSRILLAWVDEAENVSEAAWRKLLPTVREDDSEVWITWNPENKDSATDKRFRQVEHKFIVEMNYNDNPFFPDVLEQERLNDQANLDDATYAGFGKVLILKLQMLRYLTVSLLLESLKDTQHGTAHITVWILVSLQIQQAPQTHGNMTAYFISNMKLARLVLRLTTRQTI